MAFGRSGYGRFRADRGDRVRAAFGATGFLVRESVLGAAEPTSCGPSWRRWETPSPPAPVRVGAGPEHELADGHRIQFSSRTGIQWEWADGSQQIRLLEPCDHLHPRLADLFADERLTGPAGDALGVEPVVPFTSKLNFKRAEEGSEFPWHQDYPYWYVAVGEDAQDVITAIVFLDDATVGQRCRSGAPRLAPARAGAP